MNMTLQAPAAHALSAAKLASPGRKRKREALEEAGQTALPAELQQDAAPDQAQEATLSDQLSREQQQFLVEKAIKEAKVFIDRLAKRLEDKLGSWKQAETAKTVLWAVALRLQLPFGHLFRKECRTKHRKALLNAVVQLMTEINSLDQQLSLDWPSQPVFLDRDGKKWLNYKMDFLPPSTPQQASSNTTATQMATPVVPASAAAAAPATALPSAPGGADADSAATHQTRAPQSCLAPHAANCHAAVNVWPAADISKHQKLNAGQQAGSSGQEVGADRQHAGVGGRQAGSSGRQAGTHGQHAGHIRQQSKSRRQQRREHRKQVKIYRQLAGVGAQPVVNNRQQIVNRGQQLPRSGQQRVFSGQQVPGSGQPPGSEGSAVMPPSSRCAAAARGAAMANGSSRTPAAVVTAAQLACTKAQSGVALVTQQHYPGVTAVRLYEAPVAGSRSANFVHQGGETASAEAAQVASSRAERKAARSAAKRAAKKAARRAARRAEKRSLAAQSKASSRATRKRLQMACKSGFGPTDEVLVQDSTEGGGEGLVATAVGKAVAQAVEVAAVGAGCPDPQDTLKAAQVPTVKETAGAMLKGTPGTDDRLPVTTWALSLGQTAGAYAASLPGRHATTASAASSLASHPASHPASLPAELAALPPQAPAAPALSVAALPASSAYTLSAADEDAGEQHHEPAWLGGHPQQQQQTSISRGAAQLEGSLVDQAGAPHTAGLHTPVKLPDPPLAVAIASGPQPATHAVVSHAQLAAAAQSHSIKDRPPQYQHIRKSVYTRGVMTRRKHPPDETPICNCLGPLPARGGTGGHSSRHHSSRQFRAEAAAAAADPAPMTNAQRCRQLPTLPRVDGTAELDLSCDISDSKLEQAMLNVDKLVSCLSVEEPEGSGLPIQPPLLPSAPFSASWAAPFGGGRAHGRSPARAACGDSCLNRQLSVLCNPKTCPCGAACSNRPFDELESPLVEAFLTPNKGWGVKAAQPIQEGTFVVEFVGEIINHEERARRMAAAKQVGAPHFYLMELEGGVTIDGRHKSNIARLINTSCSPNCCTQKWVNAATGETRVGIFAQRDIADMEELSYDYRFTHNGQPADAYRCMCGSSQCKGTLLHQPKRIGRPVGNALPL